MAVLDTYEMLDGRTGGEGATRRYQRLFMVITDGTSWAREAISAVKTYAGIYYGAAYILPDETDLNAVVTDIGASQDDESGRRWKVTVEYSTKTKDGKDPSENEPGSDPTERAPIHEFDAVMYKRIVEKDLDGNPLTNSAGQYFDPPVEVDAFYLQMTITRTESSFDPATILKHLNKVNKKKFYGYEKKRVICTGLRSRETFEEGAKLFQCSYIFLINPDEDWDPKKILDQGRYVKPEKKPDGSTASESDKLQVVAATGLDGEPSMDPVLLNGAGKAQTTVMDVPGTSPLRKVPRPVYLEFKMRGESDFNQLRF